MRNKESDTHPALQQVASSHSESNMLDQLPQEQIKLQKSVLIPNPSQKFICPLISRIHSAPQLHFVPAIGNISDCVHAIFVCYMSIFALYVVFFDRKAIVFVLHTVLRVKACKGVTNVTCDMVPLVTRLGRPTSNLKLNSLNCQLYTKKLSAG